MKKGLMNNIGLKILAFVIAFMAWIAVVNIDDPVTYKTFSAIPVTVIHEEVLANAAQPQTYQIVDNTQEVDVTVTAKRKVLSKIKEENIVAVADMKELTLDTQLPIDITINGYEGDYESAESSPRNLQVKLDDEETKRFPIVPTTTGTVRDGYILGEIQADPEKVSIRGPKTVIESISRVEAKVSVSGLAEDTVLESELTLYDEDNNAVEQNLLSNNLGTGGVKVKVKLLRTKNVEVEFDTSGIRTADGYQFTGITYEPQTIQICGQQSVLDQVGTIRVPASALSVNGLAKRTEEVIDVSGYLPDNIKLADDNASSIVVTVNVEKDGTTTLDMTKGSIAVNNLDEDLTMSYTTADILEVQIAGPEELLEDLKLEQASIDLSDCKKAGVYTVPVSIVLPEGCTLLKNISVEVELKEKE